MAAAAQYDLSSSYSCHETLRRRTDLFDLELTPAAEQRRRVLRSGAGGGGGARLLRAAAVVRNAGLVGVRRQRQLPPRRREARLQPQPTPSTHPPSARPVVRALNPQAAAQSRLRTHLQKVAAITRAVSSPPAQSTPWRRLIDLRSLVVFRAALSDGQSSGNRRDAPLTVRCTRWAGTGRTAGTAGARSGPSARWRRGSGSESPAPAQPPPQIPFIAAHSVRRRCRQTDFKLGP